VEPEAGFREGQEQRLAEELAKKGAALGAEGRQALREKEAALEAYQNRDEDPAVLASLPHLSRKDLSPDPETAPHSLHDAGGVPLLAHELFTNGICYMDLAIPVDILDPEDYQWLPFFCGALPSVGLPGMDYGEVSGLLARTVGGFYGVLRSGSLSPGAGSAVATPSGVFDLAGRDWLLYHLKCLDEKLAEALPLVLRLIREADFSDARRVRDLILDMKNDAEASLAPGGHHYAASRSARFASRASAVNEVWTGLGQISFARYLATLDSAEILSRLCRIRDTLAGKGGLIVNCTGSAEAMAYARGTRLFRPLGPPSPRNPRCAEAAFFQALGDAAEPLSSPARPGPAALPEVFASPSLQIGFAALTFSSSPVNTRAQAAELVLAHQLSTGPLWEDIRMKGGAYGAFAHTDSLEGVFAMSTFRDPDPLRSLDSFRSALHGMLASAAWEEDSLEKAIVGAYAREIRPRTPAERGGSDFIRFLYGINDEMRSRRLQWLIDLRGGEMTEALRRLAGQDVKTAAIIAGPAAAEKAAKDLGVTVKTLPV
jgi:Zn-dependent M16 (insulinase) family peptidase